MAKAKAYLGHKEKDRKTQAAAASQQQQPTPAANTETSAEQEDQAITPAKALSTWLASSGEDARAAYQALSDSLVTIDDVVSVAVTMGQTHPLSETKRGGRYAMENDTLRSLAEVLRKKLALERQRAAQLKQTERLANLERCGEVLGVEHEIPRALLVTDGKVDVVLENLFIKLELRALLYELAALKTVVNVGEECSRMATKTRVLQEGIRKAESQRKESELLLANALAFKDSNKDCTIEDGLVLGPADGAPGQTVVKSGTVVRLIERLFSTSKVDSRYEEAFLLTYRSFTDGATVLRETARVFNDAKEAPGEAGERSMLAEQARLNKNKTRQRVIVFVKDWVLKHFFDFEQDPALLAAMKQFIADNQDEPLMRPLSNIMSHAEDKEKRLFTNMFSKAAPAVIPIVVSGTGEIAFTDVDPVEMARQLTIAEFGMLRKIRSCELLSCGWSKKDKEKRSPNLLRMIQHFNDVTGYVSALICRETNLARRVALVQRVLRIIVEAQKQQNYFAVFELSAGLNTSAVSRLKRTWEEVGKDRALLPDKVMALTSPQGNFSAYRNALRVVSGPCIPYLGQYLSDLTFIEDGNPDVLENGFVNFEKCNLVARAIINFKQFQDAPYNLTPIPEVQDWISSWASPSEKEVFDMSLQAEPRQSK